MTKISNIVRDPNICRGQPVIKGTRVLVLDILEYIKNGDSIEELIEAFPTITKSDIQEIIKYAERCNNSTETR